MKMVYPLFSNSNIINIKKITTELFFENTYVLQNGDECIIIDPGCEFSEILCYFIDNKIKPVAILLTHGHFDHITAAQKLKEYYKINIYINSLEKKNLNQANNLAFLSGYRGKIILPAVDIYLDKSEKIEISNFKLEIIHTPGHSPGGLCIKHGNDLFTGDLLFKNKIGRFDLPGGNYENICNSLYMIAKLDKDTKIYPGHGDETSLADELLNNIEFIKAINNEY